MPSSSFESPAKTHRPPTLRLEKERGRFPSASEIESILQHADRQEDICRRLQAPFDYLPEHQRVGQRRADRAATSLMRKAWLFEEPDIEGVKEGLRYKDLKAGRKIVTPAEAHDFLVDYFKLLSESCVMQKEIFDHLSQRDNDGRPGYVATVEEALEREDRYQRLVEAIELYRRTYAHEQTRFAHGSSLKIVMDSLVTLLPEAWHQIAMTPRRGEMERRFDREMLDYRFNPDPEQRQRIVGVYFNGQMDEAEKAFAKYASMPDKVVRERVKVRSDREARLAALDHKVTYGRIGEEPDLPRLSNSLKSGLDTLNTLLWVDNDFEKVLDQKMLLDHDLYLRLQLGNLLIACYPTLERPSFDHLKSADRQQCKERLDQLIRQFGRGAFIFGISDQELERRLKLIEGKLDQRLTAEKPARPESVNPFAA